MLGAIAIAVVMALAFGVWLSRPLKRLESGKLRRLGWRPAVDFWTALAETYQWFLQHVVTEDPEDAHAVV